MLDLSHKKLGVWSESIQLTTEIYRVTSKFPGSELYGMIAQMRRASVSVPSNISEGASRKGKRERKRFYEIARSSLVELDTQLEIALLLEYISEPKISEIRGKINLVFAMLSNLIKSTS